MLIKIRPLVLLALILTSSICIADHLPPELLASGRPEKRLAGIHLGRTKVSDIIKMYGKATEIKKQNEPPNANWVDSYDYYWKKPGIKLHLVGCENDSHKIRHFCPFFV